MNNDLKIAANAFLGVNPELLSAIKVSKSFAGDLSLCKIKKCFDNSYLFSMQIDSERYKYCLVVAYKIIPIEHAILFDKLTGKYVDPTFEAFELFDEDCVYHLIKQFSYNEMLEHCFEFGYPPMLEHCSNLIKRNDFGINPKEFTFDQDKFNQIFSG